MSCPEVWRMINLGMMRGFGGTSEKVDFSNPGKDVEIRNMNGRLLEKGDDGLWKPISPQHKLEYLKNHLPEPKKV